MKRTIVMLRAFQFWILVCIFIIIVPAFSQSDNYQEGVWKGTLHLPGFELEIAMQLKYAETWEGDMDIPQQGISNMALQALHVSSDSISFRLPEVPGNAEYAGGFSSGYKEIIGIFTQAGQILPLSFEKVDAIAVAAEKQKVENAAARIRLMTDSLLNLRNLPGLGFGIIMNGEIVLSDGFGFADVENEVPVSQHTLFAIGSCSKAFTSMGLAMLEEKGELEWEKPVINYMPDFSLSDDFATREMTTIDLLTHQSGLPRHDLMWYGSPLNRQELYERLKYLPFNKSFRSTWQYQNLMYMTAGILIERLSGESWEEFTRKNIFNPLGMSNSYFSWEEIPSNKERALAYTMKMDKPSLVPYRNIVNVAPAGSINSSVNEMLKWVQFLLEGGKVNGREIVKRGTIYQLHHPHKIIENSETAQRELSFSSYGLGWGVGYYRGTKSVSHTGGIDGFSALVYLLPHENIGMVLLCNASGAGLNGVLARTATDLLLGNEKIDWYKRIYGEENDEEEEENEEPKQKEPISGTKPSHELQEYKGEYEHPAYGKITISLKDDHLELKYNAWEQALEHWHYDVFNLKLDENQNMLLGFHSDQDGFIDRITAALEPTMDHEFEFTKLPPDLMSDEYIDRISGDYVLENTTEVNLEMKEKKLFVTLTGQPPYELEPLKDNEYKLVILNGYSLKFYFDEKNAKASYCEFIQPNGIFKAERVEKAR